MNIPIRSVRPFILAGIAFVFAGSTIFSQVAGGTLYEAWKADYNVALDTPDTDDSDGDGMGILLEYAVGGDPNRSEASPITGSFAGPCEAILTFPQLRSELRYWVETSENLVDWTAEGVVQGTGRASMEISSDLCLLRLVVANSEPPTVRAFSRICVHPMPASVRTKLGPQDISSLELPASFGTTYPVATADEFAAAVDAAQPGDLISVQDGTYNWGVRAYGDGTMGGSGFEPEERVWVRPSTPGGVIFTATEIDIDARYMTFADFTFRSSRLDFSADGNRATFCTFSGPDAAIHLNPGNSITINDVEVDNNLFTGQTRDSFYMATRPFGRDDRSPTPKRTWIHHNRFEEQLSGGRPSLGAGIGYHPFPEDQPAYTLIEYNIFDRCIGDDETIELKHRGAWIRFNLLENSPIGHFSGRMTGNSHFTGNIHYGGKQLRMFGNENTAVFNLMKTVRSIVVSHTEPIDNPNIDYAYLAMVDQQYLKNVFWENSVWMLVQDTVRENINPSRGNTIRDNMWLGGQRAYSDPQGQTPYAFWLEHNPNGAFPGDNVIMEDDGDDCYKTGGTSLDFAEVVIPGEWTTEHRGESNPDVVHRLPFWWDELLTFD